MTNAFQEGEVVDIYKDWQQESGFIGVAMLERKVSGGYPFILNEMKEHDQIVYNYEEWEVKFLTLSDLGKSIVHPEKKIFKIRYVDKIGQRSAIAYDNEDFTTEYTPNTIIDSFLKVDGVEIF